MDNIVNVQEGIHDPNILKAFLLVGGPGSGRSTISKTIFGIPNKLTFSDLGLKYVSSDIPFERLLKKAGHSLNISNMDPDYREKIRNKAKDISDTALENYLAGRLGIIVEGTGKDTSRIKELRDKFLDLGYDCYLLFINTSKEKALERNKKRERVLPDEVVVSCWNDVQHNMGAFQSMFGKDNLIILDNNSDSFNIEPKIESIIRKLAKSPVKNKKGIKWMNQQKQLKESADINSNIKKYFIEIIRYFENIGIELKPYPKLKLVENADNAKKTLGKTGHYDSQKKEITLYTEGRHDKDVLRSFAHELIHHNQLLRLGELVIGTQNINNDARLRKIEADAYLRGNVLFRSWENDRNNTE